MAVYELPELDYSYDALEPHIAAEIMELHHSKHHQNYVNGANAALEKLQDAREKGNIGTAVTALSKEAVRAEREVGCLVQVALDADASGRGERGGVAPGGIEELADLVAGSPGLRLDGLMTVAPLTGEYAGREQAAFERLMDLSTDLRRVTGAP